MLRQGEEKQHVCIWVLYTRLELLSTTRKEHSHVHPHRCLV
jgi:hypothetical protein